MQTERASNHGKLNIVMLCTSATAFCALLIRPLPASWVIAPTVVAGVCMKIIRFQNIHSEKYDSNASLRIKLSAYMISAFLALVFTAVWLRTMRVVSLKFFDQKAALPVLLVAVVSMYLAVPFIIKLLQVYDRTGYGLADCSHCHKKLNLTGKDRRFLFCIAVVTISVCSMSSPLYPFNDWVDANCFFTVGKSILHGLIPYQDLYEQKGPFLYIIYALSYLISHTSFLGVWLMEIAAAFVFLSLALRCFFYLTGKISPVFILLTAAIVYTAPSFLKGGGAEEFCLPLLMMAFNIGLKAVLENREVTLKEGVLVGLTSGAVLWIKYSMIGFYLGFLVIIAWQMLRKGRIWNLVKLLVCILAGGFLITVPVLIYFGHHRALDDLWLVYFYNNAFVYGKASSLSATVKGMFSGAASMLTYNDTTILLLILCLFTLWKTRQWNLSLYVFSTFLFTFVLIYTGGINQKYYSEILCIFVPIGLAQLWNLTGALIEESDRQRIWRLLLPLLFVIALFGNENRGMLFRPRSEMPQYIFAETLKEHPGATLFNYGSIDIGLYTTADIVPSTRYFCMLNLQSEEMISEIERYMAEGVTDYMVSRGLSVDSPYYRLIQSAYYPDSGVWYTYYLYEHL